VLFDNIKGYPKVSRRDQSGLFPATTALAFGLDPKLTGLDIIRAWKERLGKPEAAQARWKWRRGRLPRNCRQRRQSGSAQFPDAALARSMTAGATSAPAAW
jgi:hypothetical protein